jgi:hypothetical protein
VKLTKLDRKRRLLRLAQQVRMHDLWIMAKSPSNSKAGRSAASGRYMAVGRTSDGVTVLKPSKPATHFTARQARTTINSQLGSAKK